jgi:hypothetical protein
MDEFIKIFCFNRGIMNGELVYVIWTQPTEEEVRDE